VQHDGGGWRCLVAVVGEDFWRDIFGEFAAANSAARARQICNSLPSIESPSRDRSTRECMAPMGERRERHGRDSHSIGRVTCSKPAQTGKDFNHQ
jgi:hypothetical protein